MKKRIHQKRPLAHLLALTLVLLVFITPALAAYSKTISVYTGISIYLDDKKLEPKDANGNPVEVFVYNGTTYLPVRAISNALEIPIQWDGKTSSVYIGKHTGDNPATYLGEMDYLSKRNISIEEELTDNLGDTHQYCISCGPVAAGNPTIKYILNGQYRQLTGTMFLDYSHRDTRESTTYKIYADGEKIWSGKITAGVQPVDFTLDITGVLELTIEGNCGNGHLGDLGLWT